MLDVDGWCLDALDWKGAGQHFWSTYKYGMFHGKCLSQKHASYNNEMTHSTDTRNLNIISLLFLSSEWHWMSSELPFTGQRWNKFLSWIITSNRWIFEEICPPIIFEHCFTNTVASEAMLKTDGWTEEPLTQTLWSLTLYLIDTYAHWSS